MSFLKVINLYKGTLKRKLLKEIPLSFCYFVYRVTVGMIESDKSK